MEIFLGLEEGMLSQERVLLMLSISHHDYQMDYKFSATMHNAKKVLHPEHICEYTLT
jgi:hypothetical protein